MSVFGVTSYGLVTQKGRTFVPFIRGTGFPIAFAQTAFNTCHILTADHVARPQRHGHKYGNDLEIGKMRDRHVSCKLHMFEESQRYAVLPLEFRTFPAPQSDVCVLRIEREKHILEDMSQHGLPPIVPFELDMGGLKQGEPLEVLGLHMLGEDTIEDRLSMVPRTVVGNLAAKYVSQDFGTVLLASTTEGEVSAGMHGSPVVRAGTNNVVGVFVGECLREAPQRTEAPKLLGLAGPPDGKIPEEVRAAHDKWRRENMHAPTLDISSNEDLMNSVGSAGFAFVPTGEFGSYLRHIETQ
jgi:hypothetical protein